MRNTGEIRAHWTDRSLPPHAVRERFALRETKSQQQQQQHQQQAVCANIFFIFFVCRKKRSTSSYYSTAVN
jgi:hypothetical protein